MSPQVGKIGQLVVEVPNELSLTHPKKPKTSCPYEQTYS
jgi:hypothetical protein